jgi:hypothetical protein
MMDLQVVWWPWCQTPLLYPEPGIQCRYLCCPILEFSQIEDVADGAVKPPPNKIPIFFFGTHET